MIRKHHIAILSDVHYACAAEQARGGDYEYRDLKNPFIRLTIEFYRHFIWLRHPLGQNARLDEFLARVGTPDWVIANGDYNCDTSFVGLADDSSLQSARECLEPLRQKFGPKFHANFGDHELGKLSLLGGRGGLRLESFRRGCKELGLEPFWRLDFGNNVLLGVTSSLIALPLFEPDMLPEERAEWYALREEHLAQFRGALAGLKPKQRVILFCHDPSALPFLAHDDLVRPHLSRIEMTIIGHLHSRFIFRVGRILSGMPRIHFLGHTILRISTALSKAKSWRPFKVQLCPSLAGIELFKDGGYCTLELDDDASEPARLQFHRMKR